LRRGLCLSNHSGGKTLRTAIEGEHKLYRVGKFQMTKYPGH